MGRYSQFLESAPPAQIAPKPGRYAQFQGSAFTGPPTPEFIDLPGGGRQRRSQYEAEQAYAKRSAARVEPGFSLPGPAVPGQIELTPGARAGLVNDDVRDVRAPGGALGKLWDLAQLPVKRTVNLGRKMGYEAGQGKSALQSGFEATAEGAAQDMSAIRPLAGSLAILNIPNAGIQAALDPAIRYYHGMPQRDDGFQEMVNRGMRGETLASESLAEATPQITPGTIPEWLGGQNREESINRALQATYGLGATGLDLADVDTLTGIGGLVKAGNKLARERALRGISHVVPEAEARAMTRAAEHQALDVARPEVQARREAMIDQRGARPLADLREAEAGVVPETAGRQNTHLIPSEYLPGSGQALPTAKQAAMRRLAEKDAAEQAARQAAAQARAGELGLSPTGGRYAAFMDEKPQLVLPEKPAPQPLIIPEPRGPIRDPNTPGVGLMGPQLPPKAPRPTAEEALARRMEETRQARLAEDQAAAARQADELARLEAEQRTIAARQAELEQRARIEGPSPKATLVLPDEAAAARSPLQLADQVNPDQVQQRLAALRGESSDLPARPLEVVREQPRAFKSEAYRRQSTWQRGPEENPRLAGEDAARALKAPSAKREPAPGRRYAQFLEPKGSTTEDLARGARAGEPGPAPAPRMEEVDARLHQVEQLEQQGRHRGPEWWTSPEYQGLKAERTALVAEREQIAQVARQADPLYQELEHLRELRDKFAPGTPHYRELHQQIGEIELELLDKKRASANPADSAPARPPIDEDALLRRSFGESPDSPYHAELQQAGSDLERVQRERYRLDQRQAGQLSRAERDATYRRSEELRRQEQGLQDRQLELRQRAAEEARQYRAGLEREGVGAAPAGRQAAGPRIGMDFEPGASVPRGLEFDRTRNSAAPQPAPAVPGPDPGALAPYTVAGHPVHMGGMEAVKRVPMPALVNLVKDLTGRLPRVDEALVKLGEKLGGEVRGRFRAGRVALNPRIFRDLDTATRTFAHEIGHVVDWFSDGTTRRGNLLGHVESLRGFMRKELGGVMNAELKRELVDLSTWWKPYDRNVAAVRRYRESAEELYADALSVMLNNADEFKRRAPKFADAFFKHLDKKPQVKDALVKLYETLNQDPSDLIKSLRQDVQADFVRAEKLDDALRLDKERKDRDVTARFRDAVAAFKDQFVDKGAYVKDAAAKLKKQGRQIAEDVDPELHFDSYYYHGSKEYLSGLRWNSEVLEPLRKTGLTENQLGEFMLYKRIVDGDRAGFANPHGLTPVEAHAALKQLTGEIGPKGAAALDQVARAARDVHWEAVKDMVDAGTLDAGALAKLEASSKGNYATFAVIDHLYDQVPAHIREQTGYGQLLDATPEAIEQILQKGDRRRPPLPEASRPAGVTAAIKRQTGTFAAVMNPSTATLMKTMAIHAWNHSNGAKKKLVEFLAQEMPGELRQLRQVGDRAFERAAWDKGTLELHVDGKPTAWQVDKRAAEIFESTPYQQLGSLVDTMTKSNDLFRAIWIAYSPAFQSSNFFGRDIARTERSIVALGAKSKLTGGFKPTLGVLSPEFFSRAAQTLWRYRDSLPQAWKYARNAPDHLVQQMIREGALPSPAESFTGAMAGESTQAHLIRQHTGLGRPAEVGRARQALTNLADWWLSMGKAMEAVPKIQAYKDFTTAGVEGAQRAHYVRTYAGTPNFAIKGKASTLSNKLFLFSNMFVQGWRSDLRLARGAERTAPKTWMGFWTQMAKQDLMPKALMAAAAGGAFAAVSPEIQEAYSYIPESDKTNFICIPVGWEEGGPHGKRVRYIKMYHDETAAFFGGLLWKTANAPGRTAEQNVEGFSQFALGQLPGLAPGIDLAGKALDVAKGVNPVDEFRQKPIMPQKEFDAGLFYRGRGYLRYTLRQGGDAGNWLASFVPGDESTAPFYSWAPANTYPLNRFFKVSDYGQTEQEIWADDAAKQQKALSEMGYGGNTRLAKRQFAGLQKDKTREPNQERAYELLQDFNAELRDEAEQISELEGKGRDDQADARKQRLEAKATRIMQRVNQLLGRRGR